MGTACYVWIGLYGTDGGQWCRRRMVRALLCRCTLLPAAQLYDTKYLCFLICGCNVVYRSMFTHLGEKFWCFGAFAKLRKATIIFVMSVCPSVRPTDRPTAYKQTSTPTARICMKINKYFSKISSEIHVPLQSDKKNPGTLLKDQYTFMIIYRSFLLIIRNVSDKPVQKIKTHSFRFNNLLFFENHAVYEMWKNVLQPDTRRMTL